MASTSIKRSQALAAGGSISGVMAASNVAWRRRKQRAYVSRSINGKGGSGNGKTA